MEVLGAGDEDGSDIECFCVEGLRIRIGVRSEEPMKTLSMGLSCRAFGRSDGHVTSALHQIVQKIIADR